MHKIVVFIIVILGSTAFGATSSTRTKPYQFAVGIGQYSLAESEYLGSSGETPTGIRGKGIFHFSKYVGTNCGLTYLTGPTGGTVGKTNFLFDLNVEGFIADLFILQAGIASLIQRASYDGGTKTLINPSYTYGLGIRVAEKFEILYQVFLHTPQKGGSFISRTWIGASYVF